MTENEISYKIRGAIFDVYNTLGPGLLESVYQQALAYELSQQKKISSSNGSSDTGKLQGSGDETWV